MTITKPGHALNPGRYDLDADGKLWPEGGARRAVAIVTVRARQTDPEPTSPAPEPKRRTRNAYAPFVAATREKRLKRSAKRVLVKTHCRICGEESALSPCEYCRAYDEAAA